MQLPPTTFSRTLDAEFKRVADDENKTMEGLIEEISLLVNRKAREIYNWRSGKWPMPSSFIAPLCRRFKSLALLNTLLVECSDVKIEIPEGSDLLLKVSVKTRKTLSCYEQYIKAFESGGGIEPHEMPHLREALEEVIRGAYEFLGIAAADLERRMEARNQAESKRSSSDHSKRSLNNPSDHALTHGGGRS